MRDGRRRISQRQLRSLDLLPLLMIIVLVSLLAGCGAVPANAPVAASSAPAPTSTATPAAIVNTSSYGCLSGQPPAGAASFLPDVIVNQNSQVAGTAQTITLARGQRLEIRLPSMFTWKLMMSGAGDVLAITGPQGWYDTDLHVCVWRFTAVGAGEAMLAFDGDVVCPPLKLCPSIEQSVVYRVAVQ